MSKRVLALGYPIGFTLLNNNEFFNVQLNDRMYPLNLIATYLWLNSMNLESPEKIKLICIDELKIRGFNLDVDFNNKDIEDMYNLLLDNRLIIEFDDTNEGLIGLFNEIKDINIIRKGFGLGIENDRIFILHNNEKCEITPNQYLLWQLCDSKKMFSDVYNIAVKNIKLITKATASSFTDEELKSVILRDILDLYMRDLLGIISI